MCRLDGKVKGVKNPEWLTGACLELEASWEDAMNIAMPLVIIEQKFWLAGEGLDHRVW